MTAAFADVPRAPRYGAHLSRDSLVSLVRQRPAQGLRQPRGAGARSAPRRSLKARAAKDEMSSPRLETTTSFSTPNWPEIRAMSDAGRNPAGGVFAAAALEPDRARPRVARAAATHQRNRARRAGGHRRHRSAADRYFGLTPGFFLGLQADHDLMARRRELGANLEAIKPRAA